MASLEEDPTRPDEPYTAAADPTLPTDPTATVDPTRPDQPYTAAADPTRPSDLTTTTDPTQSI